MKIKRTHFFKTDLKNTPMEKGRGPEKLGKHQRS